MGKRSVLALGIAGVLFGCGFLWQWLHQPEAEPAPQEIVLSDGAQRLAFLEANGQPERCCVATETVQLPAAADDTYRRYLALQQAQGAASGGTSGRSSRTIHLHTEQLRTGFPVHRAAS